MAARISRATSPFQIPSTGVSDASDPIGVLIQPGQHAKHSPSGCTSILSNGTVQKNSLDAQLRTTPLAEVIPNFGHPASGECRRVSRRDPMGIFPNRLDETHKAIEFTH